jgi:prolyl oligopeptidase
MPSSLEAICYLVKTDLLLVFRPKRPLHSSLANTRLRPERVKSTTVAALCESMDLACSLYPKKVLCLQGSVALTMLLRSRGYPAVLVIAARITPFESHAWVELDGVVLNAKPYVRELFRELKRC